jgi:hypothetical protein
MTVPRALSTVAFAGAVVLLGACGGTVAENRLTAAPSGDSAPSASETAACTTGARSVCITSKANGHTVRLGIGWTVGLDLHAPGGAWSDPSEVGARLLRQIAGVRRDGGAVEVLYRTVAPGRTNLRAFERPVCPPARMCPQFVLLWEVHIRVTGR